MDNAAFRSRYQSNPYLSRKRNSGRGRITFREKLGLQIAICLFILMFAGVIKNANTDVTNSLSDNITTAINTDVNISDIFTPAMGLFSGLFDKSSTRTDSEVINPLPESSSKVSENEGVSETTAVTENTKAVATPANSTTVKYSGIFITPANGVMGTPFGDTIDPLTQKKKSHKGLDIEAQNGTEIMAAASGIVLESSFEKTLGYYIKVEHSNGYYTIYGQCSQLIAKKGQKVNQGEIIAKVGSTGVSVGSHLHFEIWKDGSAVNPSDYIKVAAK